MALALKPFGRMLWRRLRFRLPTVAAATRRQVSNGHAGPASALLLLDPALSPTRHRRLHILELRVLAAAHGVSVSPLAGDTGWLWAVVAPTEAEAASAAHALAKFASSLKGAVTDVVWGEDPARLVAAASQRHKQVGHWALRREAGGSRKAAQGERGREATAALAAALGAALGGEPAADGVAHQELALVILGDQDHAAPESLPTPGGGFLLGLWQTGGAAKRWPTASATWNQRPFHFSSGLDMRVADSCVVLALAQLGFFSWPGHTLFLDPCCGSGATFLCALQRKPAALAALDVNPRHLLGTLRNLHHAGLVTRDEHTWGEAESFLDVVAEANGEPPSSNPALAWATTRTAGDDHLGVLVYAAIRDATAGLPLTAPPTLEASGTPPWRVVGVANLAWGRMQPTTPRQTLALVAGLRRTCTAFSTQSPCRFCVVLGPDADAEGLVCSAGWRLVEGPVPVFRSNCADRVLCTVTVLELPQALRDPSRSSIAQLPFP